MHTVLMDNVIFTQNISMPILNLYSGILHFCETYIGPTQTLLFCRYWYYKKQLYTSKNMISSGVYALFFSLLYVTRFLHFVCMRRDKVWVFICIQLFIYNIYYHIPGIYLAWEPEVQVRPLQCHGMICLSDICRDQHRNTIKKKDRVTDFNWCIKSW